MTTTPDPVAPAAADELDPITENTFVARAAGHDDPPPPVKGLRRLMWWIIPGNLGIFLIWGSTLFLLLPEQITQQFGETRKVAYAAIISSVGAFVAMIAQPVIGQISDRTRSRFGRRAPWMLIGGFAGAVCLVGMAFATSFVGLLIVATLMQMFYNVAQGPLSAVMPDRVPVRRRGTFSALVGVGSMLGAVGGSILGSMFFHNIAAGYITFAIISVALLSLFVLFNPDYSSRDIALEPFQMRDFLKTFWVNPVKHPDFFWAFTGRLLLYTGYFVVSGYQLYLLTDYFHVAHPETVIPLLSLINLAGIIVSTLIAGPLSDRFGRRKPFVFASAAVVALAFVLPWMWPQLSAWILMTAIAGFGFGMFQAVDTAIMSQVLPSAQSFAKDLGVVNIAATLPQTVAPAVAGAIVLTVGYAGLFPVAIVLGILGAFAIWPIKSLK
jgi:MFS family permease